MGDNAPDPLIAVNGLGKLFGFRPALRDVNFSVARGTSLALLGPNGSGKTTLLRLLSGLSKPTSGTITIGGWSLPREVASVRGQLGVVSHLPLLYDDLTAEENLRFFARLYNLEAVNIMGMLERVGLANRSRELVRTFSRGMQQRLALARAMLHDPAVMLLDEPYTGLDISGADMLDSLIAEWKAAGRTVIVSLHDLSRATSICDQIVILNRGRVAADVSAAEVNDLVDMFAQVTG